MSSPEKTVRVFTVVVEADTDEQLSLDTECLIRAAGASPVMWDTGYCVFFGTPGDEIPDAYEQAESWADAEIMADEHIGEGGWVTVIPWGDSRAKTVRDWVDRPDHRADVVDTVNLHRWSTEPSE